MKERIDHIFLERAIRNNPIVERIRARYSSADVTLCDPSARDGVAHGLGYAPRRALFLKHHKGSFLKPFPRHEWYDKGGGVYYNLILGYNCYGSCHYCFIQSIFDDAIPTMYVNADDMLADLRSFLERDPDAWISTGEYIDSLQLDATTLYTEQIMDVMKDFPRATLELRTKSGNVDHLPTNPHARVTVAYSISPEEVCTKVEPGTASLARRLTKARALADRGYRIVVRIDPIVAVEKYKATYASLPEVIDKILGWQRVSEVFLGILRFDDQLLKTLAASTAARPLLEAEFVRCPDGKYRPSRASRSRMYRSIVDGIRKHRSDLPVTIMMEPDYVQNAAFAGGQSL